MDDEALRGRFEYDNPRATRRRTKGYVRPDRPRGPNVAERSRDIGADFREIPDRLQSRDVALVEVIACRLVCRLATILQTRTRTPARRR